MNPHYLTAWGDVLPIHSEPPHPQPAPITPDVCAICGMLLTTTVVGGSPFKICAVHGTRGVKR